MSRKAVVLLFGFIGTWKGLLFVKQIITSHRCISKFVLLEYILGHGTKWLDDTN